jgi:hypothetical protein
MITRDGSTGRDSAEIASIFPHPLRGSMVVLIPIVIKAFYRDDLLGMLILNGLVREKRSDLASTLIHSSALE